MLRKYTHPQICFLCFCFMMFLLYCLPGLLALPALENHNQNEMVIQNKINPNNVSWSSLARLPGIGRARARAIIKYCETTNKKYNNPKDLTAINGIGLATVEKIEPYLIFSHP